MITPQAPIVEPTNLNVTSEVQAAEQWQRDDVNHILKEIFLRHLVNGTIKQNEQKGVATGVTITDLASQRTLVGHNQDTEHFAASVNKIPVALLILEDLRAGGLQLDQVMTWQLSDVRAGFGTYDQPGAPLQATLREVLHDMLNRSGNTAVRILVNGALGGSANVNARFAAKPQLSHTYLIPLDANRFFLGNSTSRDSLWAFEQLMKKQDKYAKVMKNSLTTNIFADYGVRSQLAGNNYIVLANKIGLLDDVEGNNRHDVGIVYNTKTHKSYGYSFFTTAPYNETDPSATTQADQSLKDMGRYLLRFAGDKRQHQDGAPHTLRSQPLPIEQRVLY